MSRSSSPGAGVLIGEGFAGSGANAAHVNTMLGARDGPVGTAWAVALATPRSGHVPFVAVAAPNVAVVPPTLFVNKAAVAGPDHERLTWGAAQAGVAAGVARALEGGAITRDDVDTSVLVVAVWVAPDADDEGAVYANNREATHAAIVAGTRPADVDEFLRAAERPVNPFFGLHS